MVAYTHYETDNRARRYAEELARRGDHVDAVALSLLDDLPAQEEISGVTVHRIQSRKYDERHMWTYAWRLLRFLVVSSIFLARRHREIRYDLIHVHNIPDFLVFSAWYPIWTGAKLILDIHDIVPELFANKFKSRAGSIYIWFLKTMEKASTKFADHVIVSNHMWYETLISRSVPREKCSVFLNHVDLSIFYRHARTRDDGKVIVLFPGSFQWHQGLDIAIKAFVGVKKRLPNAELHLYGGRGGAERGLLQLAEGLGLKGSVKIFQGVPVVVSRTKIDAYYFDDETVRFFPSGDVEALADAMVEVIEDKPLRDHLVERGLEYVDRKNWESRRKAYLALVDSLG